MDFWRRYIWKANFLNNTITASMDGDRVSTVVMVLRYKSEGRWFDHSWCQ